MTAAPEYQVFLKRENGMRGAEVHTWVSLEIQFRFNAVSVWTLKGADSVVCPFGCGVGVVIYRAGLPFLSGYVKKITQTYKAESRLYSWTIAGEDDIGLLAKRIILPDPVYLNYAMSGSYSVEDYCSNAMLKMIHMNAGMGAHEERRIAGMSVEQNRDLGAWGVYQARFDELLKYVTETLEPDGLGMKMEWSEYTGQFVVRIYEPDDKSETVIFTEDLENISEWKNEKEPPESNFLICSGSEEEETRIRSIVTAEDSDSIGVWGRLEGFVNRSDIEPETDCNLEPDPEQIEKAAGDELLKQQAKDSYTLTVIPLEHMAYITHWDIGDIVTIRVDGGDFRSQIKEVKVNYANGLETVKPSVGTIDRGVLASIYDERDKMLRRIQIIEKKLTN